MTIEIRKIAIRNFKNLKDVVIYPKRFNVLIGPNGSGKTNFLEFFKLLRKIYVERNPYPFLEWDGYENVVWNHQRSLPIEFKFETVEKTTLAEFLKKHSWVKDVELKKDLEIDVICRISASIWADRSENLKLLNEAVEVEIPNLNYRFSIEREGESWKVRLNDREYVMSEVERLGSLHFKIFEVIESKLRFGNLEFAIDTILHIIWKIINKNLPPNDIELFEQQFEEYMSNKGLQTEVAVKIEYPDSRSETVQIGIFGKIWRNLLPQIICKSMLTLFKTIVLFPINIQEIKYKRKIVPRDELISERGENALDILALAQLKENRLPGRIEYAMEQYFNGRVYFRNMNLYFYDLGKRTEYSKEHLPDGLIKLLVILTALEQNPSMLFIDEIENSLHPELLEFLIYTLRESEGYVFVTTHSPVVLNLVEPEEIFIFKPKDDGSIEIKNVLEYKSKEELMRELEELGISLGEKVLYGFT